MDNYYDNSGMQGMGMMGGYPQDVGMQANVPQGMSMMGNTPQGMGMMGSNPQGMGGMPNPNYLATETAGEMSFSDPNSFVPQNLRQFNPQGKYFSTRGRDVYGQETKFFFTQEERDYLAKYGVTAQEFYDAYQSKLGGEYVQGMPQPMGFAGPNYRDPSSFIPADMRESCYDRGYSQFVYRDEVGFQKVAYLTEEEINFTRVANMDIGTYVNVYQKEFDYDKGQMERDASAVTVAVSQAQQSLTKTK